jgi:hypothetical protein
LGSEQERYEMANKANKNRYGTIRSVIASASILSFLPLLSVMQSGAAGDVLATPATKETSLSQDVALAVANTQTATIAAPATVAQTSQATTTTATKATSATTASSTKTQSAATYTRTKAS